MPIEWEFESWKEVMAHQLLGRSKKKKEGNCSKDKPDNVMNRNGVGVKNVKNNTGHPVKKKT